MGVEGGGDKIFFASGDKGALTPLAKSCGRWCQIVFYNVDNAVTNAKARMEK